LSTHAQETAITVCSELKEAKDLSHEVVEISLKIMPFSQIKHFVQLKVSG
jgi:hypothetical protein